MHSYQLKPLMLYFLTFEPLSKNQGRVSRMLTDTCHWDFSIGNSKGYKFHPCNEDAVLSILFPEGCVGIVHSIICPYFQAPQFPWIAVFSTLLYLLLISWVSRCCCFQEIKYLYSMYICSEHGDNMNLLAGTFLPTPPFGGMSVWITTARTNGN